MYPKNKQKVILIEEKYQFISCFWRKNVRYVKIFDFANKKYQYQGVFFIFFQNLRYLIARIQKCEIHRFLNVYVRPRK